MPEEIQGEYDRAIQTQANATQAANVQNMQTQINQDAQTSNYIKEQLYLGDELERIDYLLKGYTLGLDETKGTYGWVKPKDEDMLILSDYGINLIRQTLSWYLNKNTLLSHYDDEQIQVKMRNFAHTLNTAIYLKYQKVFRFPSFERCEQELMSEITRRAKTKVLANELLGKKIDLKQAETKIISELERGIEHQFEKISKRLMKIKYTQFEILIRQLVDLVHSAYRRAYFGMERTSLRKNIYVTETTGINPQGITKNEKGSAMNPLNWFK